MDIMASAMLKVQQSTRQHASRKWLRVVAAVGVVGLLVAGGMGAVIWKQHREIDRLVSMKGALDREIEQVQGAMEQETDEGRLAELEQRLAQLSGTAQFTLGQVAQQDQTRAEALQNRLGRDTVRCREGFAGRGTGHVADDGRHRHGAGSAGIRRNTVWSRRRRSRTWPGPAAAGAMTHAASLHAEWLEGRGLLLDS